MDHGRPHADRPSWAGSRNRPRWSRLRHRWIGPGESLNTVEAYDPATNTWATVANMPTAPVYLAGAIAPDGRIYAIGGIQEGGTRLNNVEAYDTKTNKWTTVASMPTARNALAAAKGPDGRIYAIGGHPEGGNLNPVEAYDPRPTSGLPSRACLPFVVNWRRLQVAMAASTPSAEEAPCPS